MSKLLKGLALGFAIITIAGNVLILNKIGKNEGQPQKTSTVITELNVEGSGIDKVVLKSDDKTISKPVREIKGSNNVVFFDTDVQNITVDIAVQMLKDALNRTEGQVYLLIDSPGGSVFDGARLTDFVEKSGRISTICVTLCASMGAQLHQVGKKRLTMDKSVLMFHPASGGVRGTVEEMKGLLTMIDTYTLRMDAKIAKRSGIPLEKFKIMVLKNLWVEAEDALKMGLSDGIVNVMVDDLDSVRVSTRAIDKMLQELMKIKTIFGSESNQAKKFAEKVEELMSKTSSYKQTLEEFK
jgi:ATP-dependent Clp protease protease subunit